VKESKLSMNKTFLSIASIYIPSRQLTGHRGAIQKAS
jgi:hypothetical protein